MADLPHYTLSYDEKKQDWALRQDITGRTVRRFETKNEATRGEVLENAVGAAGGSVKIQKENGVYQEERTYPRSKDPRQSRG
jgi:Uncharacterized protein conserved in bacteria (DUF2188)